MKITVEYDTATKIGSVKMDGKEVENLSSFCLYPSYYENDEGNKFSLEISQTEVDEEAKTYKRISTMAKALFPGENLDEN